MSESEGLGEGCGHSRCYACCKLSQRAVCVAEWLPIIFARWQKWRSAKVSAHSSPPSRCRLQGLGQSKMRKKFRAAISTSLTQVLCSRVKISARVRSRKWAKRFGNQETFHRWLGGTLNG